MELNRTGIIRKINCMAAAVLTAWVITLTSCSAGDDLADSGPLPTENGGPKTCRMILDVSLNGFDGESLTRAAGEEWNDGDKVYLNFTGEHGLTYGDAVYEDGGWTLSYYGYLAEGETSKCTAVFFDSPEMESGNTVILSENTAIYEDPLSSYEFSDGVLTVVAELSPKTGRIRFAGTEGEEVKIYGISHYAAFDASTGEFTISHAAVDKRVTGGFTPYIYGEFTDPEEPRLNIITAGQGYTRALSNAIFRKGESGYMNIPGPTSHAGWQNAVVLKVEGVEFTMIPVSYEGGNFLLAETETTEELFHAVTGEGESSGYPKTDVENWDVFLGALNAKTQLNFRYPTADEWTYAAKGGERSRNYRYSGSNIVSSVAWYEGNSGGELHPVKQLQPNELGFYDMSGNAAEWIGREVYCYGGAYIDHEGYCTVGSKYSVGSSKFPYVGLRIALSN